MWQVMVMFISVIVVIILGTSMIGGITTVFERAEEGGRIRFFE